MNKNWTNKLPRSLFNTTRPFAGKHVRGNMKKVRAITKRDKRLRLLTKGKFSILSFAS